MSACGRTRSRWTFSAEKVWQQIRQDAADRDEALPGSLCIRSWSSMPVRGDLRRAPRRQASRLSVSPNWLRNSP